MAEERAGHGYELMVMIAGLEWHGWLGDYLWNTGWTKSRTKRGGEGIQGRWWSWCLESKVGDSNTDATKTKQK
jgi:hypothetical protein